MAVHSFSAGEIVLREGDPSDYVGLIQTGSVEVLKHVDGGDIVLGQVGPGQFIGEMGVLEGRPRGATVRALSSITLETLTAGEFVQRISRDSQASLETLRRLSERLRAMDQRLAEYEQAPAEPATATHSVPPAPSAPAPNAPARSVAAQMPDAAPAAGQAPFEQSSDTAVTAVMGAMPPSDITVRAGNEALEEVLGPEGISVTQLPFSVGREPLERERPPREPVALAVEDAQPFRLSRLHFSILNTAEGIVVRDVGSKLGTQVNGEFIGEQAPRFEALLKAGDNEIVAGGHQSPHVFRVVVAS